MRLGLNLGYWANAADAQACVALAKEADRIGYSVVWAAEAYGSDAVTTLTWIAAVTERIQVGSAVFQIPARTPAMTAMTAASLDALSGGRFRLGLGVSGPQVSEGWHGVPFAKPLARTREYVAIVRSALARQTVRFDGDHFALPLPGGAGKPLKLAVHPVSERIPIYLAAIGPANLELTGEIADGWLSIFFAPEHAAELLGSIRAGRERAAHEEPLGAFDVVAATPVVLGADPRACAEPVRGHAALYLGGMGSREQNFYNALARRMGYEAAAEQVQELFLAKEYRAAAAAVPWEFIDRTSLLGPKERVADRMQAFAAAGVTTLSVSPGGSGAEPAQTLRTLAEALDASGVGE
ncbi:MAG TPA: LLM class F420-dependent oxidoreductase [Actinomycetes bacterium]|nr:LLM class F420-dependent oxidoreductase [Actinomycetes bacterium]